MSVEAKDIIFYGSQNIQETDSGTVGGAIDQTIKYVFADLANTNTVSVLSSKAADTTNIIVTIYGRDASGALQSEPENVNGIIKVPTAINFERLLRAVGSGTGWAGRTGDIAVVSDTATVSDTLQSGTTTQVVLHAGASATDNFYKGKVFVLEAGTYDGELSEIVKYTGSTKIAYLRSTLSGSPSTDAFSIYDGMVLEKALDNIDIVETRRPFYNVAADESSDKDYYEKLFLFNLHQTLTLSTCTVTEDNSGVYAKVHFAVASSFGDTDAQTATNRVTIPSGGIGSWYDYADGAQSIGNSGNLTNDDGVAIWLHLDLAAGDTADNDTWSLLVNGQTT